ncbi:FLG2 [Vulpes lagopus]
MARLDLNMANLDPQYKGDRELLMDNQETPLQMPSLVMEKPAGHNPVGLAEDLVSVSPVTLRGTQESDSHTQVPPMARLDLNIQNWAPQLKGDRELLMDSPETPVDMPTLAMDKPQRHNPAGLVEGNLVSLSPVTLKTTQVSHRHTPDPHILTLDLNIQSQDPHYKGDKEQLMDNQETQLHMPSLVMDKPAGHNPVGVDEVSLLSVSPVTLRGTQESHRHTQDPLKVILDLNMESRDPQYKRDRELPRDSQEIQVDMSTLAMEKPSGHNPAGLVEGNLLSASPVTLRGTQDPHRHTQVLPMVRLDLNIQNWVPQLKGDRENIMDSQKISAHMPTLAMDRPPGHYPVGLVEGNLVAVSPVTLKGTQETHKHTQNPHVLTLDLNIQSQDPHYKGERKLLIDSQETLLDMRTLAIDKPPGHNPVGLVEGNLVAVSPVTLKGTQVSHRHTQDPLVVRLDLNMESQGPQYKEDRELLIDNQETPLHMPSLVMDKPPEHNPVGLEEEDLLSVSPVTLRGTQESHRHTQDPLKVILNLNMERDTSGHAHSGHGQATRTQSSRTRRRESSGSESSDTQGHSGVPLVHSGFPHGQDGSQHGESDSTTKESQEYTHKQSGDTSGHAQSVHGQATRTQSSRARRRGSTVSESSDTQGYSGAPQIHSGSLHGQVGSEHPESESTIKRRQGTTNRHSEDTTGNSYSGQGQATRTESSRTRRKGFSGTESSDTERHSGVPLTQSGSPHGHTGSLHGELGSTIRRRQGSTHGHSRGTSGHSGSSHTQSHDTHRLSKDNIRKQSHSIHHQSRVSHSQSQHSGKQRHGSDQGWKHGSYGSAEYDYGQSGYGPSGGSRTSSRNSSPLRSLDRAANNQVSTHGQSFSRPDHTGSKATEIIGRQSSSHGQSIDSHNNSGSSVNRRQRSFHGHSIVSHESSIDTHVQFGREGSTTHRQSSNHSVSSHGQFISARSHPESNSTFRQDFHSDNKEHSEDWGKQIHEPSGSRHGQSEFNIISIHRSNQQHLADTNSHEQVRYNTCLVRQGSSNRKSGDIQGQSGFSTNESRVDSHDQSSDSYGKSSNSRSQGIIFSHSHDSQDLAGIEEYGPTMWSGDRQKQGPESSLFRSTRIYSQNVDDKQTRNTEARGCHKRERTDSGSCYLDSNTPLYEYVQEQRCYYIE